MVKDSINNRAMLLGLICPYVNLIWLLDDLACRMDCVFFCCVVFHPFSYIYWELFVYLKVLLKEIMAFAVPNYMMGGETQAREFVIPADVQENGQLDDYSYSEQQLQHIPEAESILEDNFAQSNGSLQSSMDPVSDHLSAPVEEPVGEPQKHTYASIVSTIYILRRFQLSSVNSLLLQCLADSNRIQGENATTPPADIIVRHSSSLIYTFDAFFLKLTGHPYLHVT